MPLVERLTDWSRKTRSFFYNSSLNFRSPIPHCAMARRATRPRPAQRDFAVECDIAQNKSSLVVVVLPVAIVCVILL